MKELIFNYIICSTVLFFLYCSIRSYIDSSDNSSFYSRKDIKLFDIPLWIIYGPGLFVIAFTTYIITKLYRLLCNVNIVIWRRK